MAAELKTQRNTASVKEFLDAVPNERKRKDASAVSALMAEVTGEEPAMWGKSLVGFGSYHYKYASGQEGDWPLVSFSPRKDSLTVYIGPGLAAYKEQLTTLGKHKGSGSCLHIKSLDDIHLPTLRKLVRQSVKDMKRIVRERKREAAARKK
jgi:hypothetical protein